MESKKSYPVSQLNIAKKFNQGSFVGLLNLSSCREGARSEEVSDPLRTYERTTTRIHGSFKRGRRGRNGDMSLPEYHTKPQSFRLCAIKGLTEGECSLGGATVRQRRGLAHSWGSPKGTEWDVRCSVEYQAHLATCGHIFCCFSIKQALFFNKTSIYRVERNHFYYRQGCLQ